MQKKRVYRTYNKQYDHSKEGFRSLKTVPTEKPVTNLPEYECRFCGNRWLPRINVPKYCPECHRRHWWKNGK